jgi:hypothetical protein
MNNDFLEEELRKSTPELLKQRTEKEGFQVPKGYFDTLEDRVLARIENHGHRRQPLVKGIHKQSLRMTTTRRWMATAAVFGLLCLAIWFVRQGIPAEQVAVGKKTPEDIFQANLSDNKPDAALPPLERQQNDQKETEPLPLFHASPNHDLSLEDLSPDQQDQILLDMTEDEIKEIL